MHGQVLEAVNSARYLGVDIASDLKFTQHINRITANASKSLGYLKRNIQTKHIGIREAAFKTIVRPHLEYASTVWSPHTKQDIKKIEMVQRRAVRWSLNSYSTYASVTEMQNQLETRFDVYETLCPQQMLVHKGSQIKNWSGECRDVIPTKLQCQTIQRALQSPNLQREIIRKK